MSLLMPMLRNSLKERTRDNAMYVGFAPYEKPEIAVTVVLENAGGGSSQAAPLARMMMDKYFEEREFTPKPDVKEREVSQDVAHQTTSHTH